jgi:hypothetical protein
LGPSLGFIGATAGPDLPVHPFHTLLILNLSKGALESSLKGQKKPLSRRFADGALADRHILDRHRFG